MDIVTYYLCQKIAKASSTSIKSITLDTDNNLIFDMVDGTQFKNKLPIKADAINFDIITAFPTTGVSPTTVYLMKEPNGIYAQYMYINGTWEQIGRSGAPYASTTEAGMVKVDGVSIKINDDGVISVDTDYVNNNLTPADDSDIIGLI